MKHFNHLLLAAFFGLLALPVAAQNYKSIFASVPDSTNWDIIVSGACDAVCGDNFRITGDSTINGLTYYNLNDLGFLREDTIAGKTWFYDPYWSEEYLVMDVSLSVGDTFAIYDYSNVPYTATVTGVQTVNGLKHLTLNAYGNLCSPEFPFEFVEGSGPNVSFLYQRRGGLHGTNSYSLCQHKDGIKTQGNTEFQDSCHVCFVGLTENETSRLQLFPSPATNAVSIAYDGVLQQATLRVIDPSGRVVKEVRDWNAGQVTIDLSGLHSGIYWVSLKSADHHALERFVKE